MQLSFAIITTFVGISSGFTTVEQQQRQYAPLSTDSLRRRAASACEKTYGTGSVECGSSDAIMCYNPSIGQSCCSDNGYCDSGQYCAPVSGYCCLATENLQECATNAGFELPPSLLAALASTNASMSTAAATVAPEASTKPSDTSSSSSSSSTPYIQVSAVARKGQLTLVWMSVGIGIVGVIMATF